MENLPSEQEVNGSHVGSEGARAGVALLGVPGRRRLSHPRPVSREAQMRAARDGPAPLVKPPESSRLDS